MFKGQQMNSKARLLVKNVSYVFSSNIISFIISTVLILIVPKLIGIEEYGYWQLYMFYASYMGFFHFGWNDGIYLRYGGEKYDQLDKNIFFSQFWMLSIFQLLLAIIIISVSIFMDTDIDKRFIFISVAFCMVLANMRAMPLFIFQATSRIKEYSNITMLDRILYGSFIVSLLLLGFREYELMIVADLIAKFISLLYSLYYCKDIIFRKISVFRINFTEAKENINVGIKLMFSNIASMLIIGIVRFGIERNWNVATFGKVSLTLSISNFIMIFINAIGIIIFPVLRRVDERKLSKIYTILREILVLILLGTLILYFPIKMILSIWLPQYIDSLKYMALVFPMCVYEGKMALLVNTYLKTLREEKLMLKINLYSLALSVVLTFIAVRVFNNLNFAILCIVVLLAFRCAIAEAFLSKILKISIGKALLMESIISLIFIMIGWYGSSLNSILIYLFSYMVYIMIKRKDIILAIRELKLLLKK
ncbi:hypothetical protein PH235_08350 [Trichococcus sp. K1Tr]|uniref:hypothetical protein n=1 Tax=Trichococcus sp. K1Tr TaxID=3020847 RepID=UPI00232BEEFD|nr:hypothetical protein [Trichococcus sp. K1Tr]MDB6353568.1 hypothetical protein [Trichococcus sp. K1Tr]